MLIVFFAHLFGSGPQRDLIYIIVLVTGIGDGLAEPVSFFHRSATRSPRSPRKVPMLDVLMVGLLQLPITFSSPSVTGRSSRPSRFPDTVLMYFILHTFNPASYCSFIGRARTKVYTRVLSCIGVVMVTVVGREGVTVTVVVGGLLSIGRAAHRENAQQCIFSVPWKARCQLVIPQYFLTYLRLITSSL